MTEQETTKTARSRQKPKSPPRNAIEQARDLMVDKFRTRDYAAFLELLRDKEPLVLLGLQRAMDNLEEPVQS